MSEMLNSPARIMSVSLSFRFVMPLSFIFELRERPARGNTDGRIRMFAASPREMGVLPSTLRKPQKTESEDFFS